MAAALEESTDYFAAGVIGVGDEQDGLGQVQAGEEEQEFIEESAPVAVAEDQAFVDAGAQGHGMVESADAAEESQGLTGVPHDESGLRVGLPGLVQEPDGGHLPAAFALLEAVGQDDQPAVAALDAGMDFEHEAGPDAGEAVGTEGRAVEESEQGSVAACPQAESTDEAGDAGQVRSGAEGGQDYGQPEKGAPAGTRRAQLRHHRPPVEPKLHEERS